MNRRIKLTITIAFSTVLLMCVNWGAAYAQEAPVADSLQPTAIEHNATQIASGENHSCAITDGGALQCWGNNTYGQLGDGGGTQCGGETSYVCRVVPVQVLGMATRVTSVSAGWRHTCALKDGGVRCWGDNRNGQLGDGTTEERSEPVSMVGLETGVEALDAGRNLTCALKHNGTVWCAGYYPGAPLPGYLTAAQIPDLLETQAVAVGSNHACALTNNGGVKCWGGNFHGQLGTGSRTDSDIPVDVIGLTSGVAAIAAGHEYSCALLAVGNIQCWGSAEEGQIGTGQFYSPEECNDEACHLEPVDVLGIDNASAISAFLGHTCALLEDDSLKCWGMNTWAQLGDGGGGYACSSRDVCRPGPVTVQNLAGAIQSVATGGNHTCALLANGSIQCWGLNNSAQMGIGSVGLANVKWPVDVARVQGTIQYPISGNRHNCLLLASGDVWCWGFNEYGQLGDGTLTHRNIPVPVAGLDDTAIAIAGGYTNSCAVTSAGSVMCWGDVPGLDYPNGREDGTLPRVIPGLESGALSTSINKEADDDGSACAVMVDGGIKCWGDNEFGQLGDGTKTDRHTPVNVVGLDGKALTVVARLRHTCALLESGRVQCWGSNIWGQLGIGLDAGCDPSGGVSESCHHTTPQTVDALGANVVAITGGYGHMCALLDSGGVKCWGLNYTAQVGDGTIGPADGMYNEDDIRYTPTGVVGLESGVTQLGSSFAHSCAVLDNGNIKCWGYNEHAQLGDGGGGVPCGYHPNDLCRPTPVDVAGLSGDAAYVTTGSNHTCALLRNGRMQCWGGNHGGQVGDGNRWRAEPTYVHAFEALASLTITKTVVGGSPANDWQFEGSGSIGSFTLPSGGGSDSFVLDFGGYTITETATAGYATEVGCSDGTSASGNAVTVALTSGVSVGCTFTNTQLTTSVEGIVHDEQGAGIEGATVFLTDTLPADLIGALGDNLSDVTDADGNFRIEGVPLGDYSLMVSLPGESAPSYTQPLTVSSDPVTITEPIVVSTREAVFLPSMQKP